MSLPPRYLTAYVEGVLYDDNPHPIFAKALSQGQRTIHLHPGPLTFLEAYAEAAIDEHQEEYDFEAFPIEYYVMHVSDGRSFRFSTDGEMLGEFGDEPVNARFEVDGRKFEIWS